MSQDHGPSAHRRPLLKSLGAGAMLSALGGSAVAQQEDDGDADGGGDDGGGDPRTVHTVETLIRGPPTNPDRPVDFFYQPTGLHVQPGDVVQWRFTTPDHNVVSYHPAFGMRRRVPTGVTAFSSPLLGWRPESIPGDQIEPPAEMAGEGAGDAPTPSNGTDTGGGGSNGEVGDADSAGRGPVPNTWLYAFETPGVYDLLCSPHEEYGMAMRVVVGDETEAAFETSDATNLPAPRVGPAGLARETLTDPALQPSNVVSQGTVAWEDLQATQGDGSGEGESGGGSGEGETDGAGSGGGGNSSAGGGS